MDYISEIFKRLNLQQIRSFLLYGADDNEVTEKGYKERLDEAAEPLMKILYENFDSNEDERKFVSMIHTYASTHADVYMEIGMICGASLAFQMLAHQK